MVGPQGHELLQVKANEGFRTDEDTLEVEGGVRFAATKWHRAR